MRRYRQLGHADADHNASMRRVAPEKVVRLGNRVGVAELRAFHPGTEDKSVAAGMGVYSVKRAEDGDPEACWTWKKS